VVVGVSDLFSKRQKRARGEVPDVYVYDSLPQPLRVQIVYIIKDAFGVDNCAPDYAEEVYGIVNKTLCREFGVFQLTKYAHRSDQDAVFEFFLQEESVERALDVVELCFRQIQLHRLIQIHIGKNQASQRHTRKNISADDTFTELNERFKEHGVGYQFESCKIVRVDSQFLHAEAVKPVLAVLRDKNFKGANEEFLKAHEHYRYGRYKECLVDALKAFESTMKTICSLRGWPTQPTDTAKNLIATCINNGLFPAYFDSQFSSIRSLLESGVPVVRNKNGAHGQGVAPVEVPEYLARYTLNLTATTILFMVEAHQATE
jgi:hypothetical protein